MSSRLPLIPGNSTKLVISYLEFWLKIMSFRLYRKTNKTPVLTFGVQTELRGLAWWEKGAKIVVGTRYGELWKQSQRLSGLRPRKVWHE